MKKGMHEENCLPCLSFGGETAMTNNSVYKEHLQVFENLQVFFVYELITKTEDRITDYLETTATASISTRESLGRAATWKAALAG